MRWFSHRRRTSVATLVSSRVVLAHTYADFGGRPPLECTFRITLNGTQQDLVVLVVHMKAFADLDSWQRRINAVDSLPSCLKDIATDHLPVVTSYR